MLNRELGALLCTALLLSGIFPVQAQAQTPLPVGKEDIVRQGEPTLRYEKDSLRDTWTAVVQDDAGTARFTIVKDKQHSAVKGSEAAGKPWERVTTFGKSPWGKPGTLEDIRKDPEVYKRIEQDTSLNPTQKATFAAALKNPKQPWLTIKAEELGIAQVYWGLGWWVNNAEFSSLKPEFRKTEVYFTFVTETMDWYFFVSECRNLGQPFVEYKWEATTTKELITEVELLPAPQKPVCKELSSDSAGPIAGNSERTYKVRFENPSGVAITPTFYVRDERTKEKPRNLGSGRAEVTIAGKWFSPGDHTLFVEAKTADGTAVDTANCIATFRVVPFEPPVKITKKPEPEPKLEEGGKFPWWLLALGVGLAAGGAAFVLRGGSQSVPLSECQFKDCGFQPAKQ